ncbi:MAG: hypothetical protein HC830_09155 [Bacteroidetes bacterium]|nr:hypothetical protein [Bacteroidota bacterium]
MKTILYLVIYLLAFTLYSCTNKQTVIDQNQVFIMTTQYLQQKPGYKSLDKDEIGNHSLRFDDYLINLKKREVFVGKLNADTLTDAIVS